MSGISNSTNATRHELDAATSGLPKMRPIRQARNVDDGTMRELVGGRVPGEQSVVIDSTCEEQDDPDTPAMLRGEHRFSPVVCNYLERHAVDLDLAWSLGVRSDRDTIVYPYEPPRGESYTRRRDLTAERSFAKQPKDTPLTLWWPDGRSDPDAEVLLTEGEPDALAALSALNGDAIKVAALPGTTIPPERISAELARAGTVYLAMDGDDPGKKAADKVARALQAYTHVKVIRVGDGEDLASRLHAEDDRAGWLRSKLDKAKPVPKLKPKAEPQGYGRTKAVDHKRDLLAKGIDPDKLDLAELLDDIAAFYGRYVYMTPAQLGVVAVWTVHTHSLDASRVTPYIWLTSAEAGSGKTLLLECAEKLTLRPWLTARTTAAVLPRKIEAIEPTLLLDESDMALGGDKDYAAALQGVLNSGYKRSGSTTVCVGKGAEITFRDFSTYCPKMIAGLARLPDTIRTRSIPIRLVKVADEPIEDFDDDEAEAIAAPLRDRLEAFAMQGVEKLRATKKPEKLAGVSPRTKEIATPLLAIGELAGGEWAERTRSALRELTGHSADDPSITVELLKDIRGVFQERDVDRISSKDLREALIEIDGSPWPDWRRGQAISQRAITDRLRAHRIIKRSVRFEGEGSTGTTKGYLLTDFEDTWRRHLPEETTPPPSIEDQTGHTGHNRIDKPETPVSNQAQDTLVCPVENTEKPHGQAIVSGVSGSEAIYGAEAITDGETLHWDFRRHPDEEPA